MGEGSRLQASSTSTARFLIILFNPAAQERKIPGLKTSGCRRKNRVDRGRFSPHTAPLSIPNFHSPSLSATSLKVTAGSRYRRRRNESTHRKKPEALARQEQPVHPCHLPWQPSELTSASHVKLWVHASSRTRRARTVKETTEGHHLHHPSFPLPSVDSS